MCGSCSGDLDGRLDYSDTVIGGIRRRIDGRKRKLVLGSKSGTTAVGFFCSVFFRFLDAKNTRHHCKHEAAATRPASVTPNVLLALTLPWRVLDCVASFMQLARR